jgi:hypothetical protein
MTHDIDDLFGIKVRTTRDHLMRKVIVPPPWRVMAVLTSIAIKKERPLRSATKARLRRNKRRRIERRNVLLRRNVYRSIGEAAKRD